MKTTKKVLGLVLALVMLINVFAVSSFGAGTESAVDLYLTADKATYAPGDEIVLTFSVETIAAVGDITIGGQYAIGYNSAAIQPYSDDVTSLTAHGMTPIASEYDTTNSGIADTLDKTIDSGWDAFIVYNCVDTGVAIDATTKTDLFSLKMKVSETAADGTYTIGFNKSTYQAYDAYVTDMAMGGIYGYDDDYGYGTTVNYGFNNVTITVSSAPAIEVTHEGQQSKWNGGNTNNTAENYLFSFVGKFTGIDVATETATVDGVERDQVTNIESITAVATYSKTGATVECDTIYTIWEDGDGYKFRAVFRGFNPTDDGTMTVKFVVTMKDGTVYTESPYESVEYGRVINDIYTASVGNGFPEVA